MKKLFTLVSAILCAAVLALSVSAAESPPLTPAADPYAAFKRVMDTSCTLRYAEIKGDAKSTTSSSGGLSDTSIYASDIKMAVAPNGDFSARVFSWNGDSEIDGLSYVKNGYYFDSLSRKKYKTDSTIKSELYGMVGIGVGIDDLEDMTMETKADGYEFRYRITGDLVDFSCFFTVFADRDYMLKSVKFSYRNTSEHYETKVAAKFEFVSVNKPFTIDFPYDLNAYELVD